MINGAFYAVLSLGLSVIFGTLGIINFAHGALFMMGAFFAWMLLEWFGIGYWPALVLSPICVGAFALVLEKVLIRRLYKLDHIYAFLLTFGVALMIEALFQNSFGSAGKPYSMPGSLRGAVDLDFMILPYYRLWVVVASLVLCTLTWYAIERTSLGANLRAATENALIVQALGINVPRMMTLTYAGGASLAAIAGVLAAPIYSVGPHMGTNLVIVVFAVVVIGGMGSIKGSVIAGFGLGVIEGLTRVVYAESSSTVIFLVMAIVLLVRPRGLFGRVA
jgi:branched-chain amino acid transport system permease protein